MRCAGRCKAVCALRFAGLTDPGKVRSHNEDRWSADDVRGLFVVSDGIARSPAGGLAAQVVVELLPGYFDRYCTKAGTDGDVPTCLQAAIAALSDDLNLRSARTPGLAGTGATVVAALVEGDRCFLAHLGDSRAYLWRAGRLTQLTGDHTIVQALLNAGEVTDAEAVDHPGRHQLTRYAGMKPPALPEIGSVALELGDRLLLCTDGVSGAVREPVLEVIIGSHSELSSVCAAIIQAANDAGGRDNSTALVVAM